MTAAILIFIALMWFPTALLILGYGEPKATGFADFAVGLLVVIGATLTATVFKDTWTAGLLYIHGTLYMTVGYSFMTEQTDLRPMGNVSLITGLASTVYALVWLIGGPVVDGAPLVAANWSLFIMATIYAILTYEVTLNCYGKLSGKVLAWSLIIAIPLSLWIPAYWILVAGKLPF